LLAIFSRGNRQKLYEIPAHNNLTATLAFSVAASLEFQKAYAQAVKGDESSPRERCIPAKDNSITDLTIVEYFDYQCAPCKKVYRVLQQIAHEDGQIQLIVKDWPIFGGISTYAARLGLAAKYQNKYSEAREALISVHGKMTRENVLTTLSEAEINISRLKRDYAIHQKEIEAILADNQKQAAALELEGTPALVIGHFRVPAMFDIANMKNFIAAVRASTVRLVCNGRRSIS
jgi:protein-disulfide isomerase